MILTMTQEDNGETLGTYRVARVELPAEEVAGEADGDTVEGYGLWRRIDRDGTVTRPHEVMLPRRGMYHETLESAVTYAVEDAVAGKA